MKTPALSLGSTSTYSLATSPQHLTACEESIDRISPLSSRSKNANSISSTLALSSLTGRDSKNSDGYGSTQVNSHFDPSVSFIFSALSMHHVDTPEPTSIIRRGRTLRINP